MIQFKEEIELIWFILGTSCNLRCKYCVQAEKSIAAPVVIDNYVYDFINNLCDRQKKVPVIKFYGGEPLLYWDNIYEFVQKLGHRVRYCLVSNGLLFDEEKVRFCNDNNIKVIISWDGKASKLSRGIDVFDVRFNELMKIDRLMIHSVFNGYTSIRKIIEDVEKLDSCYYAEKSHHIGFGGDIIIPYCEDLASVYNLNVRSISADIDYYFDKYYRNEYLSSAALDFIYKNIQIYRQFLVDWKGEFNCYNRRCSYGVRRLNLDSQGKLYMCRNITENIADINWNYDTYIKKLHENDFNSSHFLKCNKCPVVPLCRGGCKIMPDSELFCRSIFNFYYPMLKWLRKLC